MQTWSYVLLFKFTAYWQFVPHPRRCWVSAPVLNNRGQFRLTDLGLSPNFLSERNAELAQPSGSLLPQCFSRDIDRKALRNWIQFHHTLDTNHFNTLWFPTRQCIGCCSVKREIFWLMITGTFRCSMVSTSATPICASLLRTKLVWVSLIWRCASAPMVSNSRDDLPEPEKRIKDARSTLIKGFHTFCLGVLNDFSVVQKCVYSSMRNGQVEEQVNKLKMIKRQMYGRASFNLLRKRLVCKE